MGLLTETEYLACSAENSGLLIHMHLDAIEAIRRDVLENPEVGSGGLLLGTVEKGSPGVVRIERHESAPFTTGFDYAALESAASKVLAAGNLSVVGVYRTHLNPGFQPEPPDFEAADRYFNDPTDLLLLIKPQKDRDLQAQFFARNEKGGFETTGPLFPFRGGTPGSASTEKPGAAEQPAPVQPGPTELAALAEPARAEPPRRLVPDFIAEPAESARSGSDAGGFSFNAVPSFSMAEPRENRIRAWWPLFAALALLAGVLFLLIPVRHSPAESSAPTQNPARPLGLAVAPGAQTWTVSWNPNATALRDFRSVQLFVREGDDQKRIELSPHDIAVGTYLYQPHGNDVTFRIEATESSGQISAESFRVMRTPAPPAPVVSAAPAQPRFVPPHATHRVPPVVPASIRPRIRGKIPVDVKVRLDEHGRVVSAVPVERRPSGLEAYLAGRAVEAARQWRFEPARENGHPVPGEQTIHFVFEK